MKTKTKLKLERKWSSLPLHHIDTSVIFGAFVENEKFREECKNYLNKVGYKYRGQLSVSVIGEIFMILRDVFDQEVDRELFFIFFDKLMRKRCIEFIGTTFETNDKLRAIREADYEIEPLDGLHLAITIISGSKVFVTLDQKLLKRTRLENKFNIRIVHPKDL